MVGLDNSTDSKNNSFPPSSPNPLHLWKRFKKVKPEEAQKLENDVEKPLRKPGNKIIHDESDNLNNLSINSIDLKTQICKRTVAQEKLFKLQCDNRYRKPSHTSFFNTDLSFSIGPLVDRKREYLKEDEHYSNENEKYVNMTGILHLKKPMSNNLDNAKKYYEDRGRMEPINWKNIPNNGIISQEVKPETKKRFEIQKETIKSIAMSKPPVSNKFSNFVENSVSNRVAYNMQGNVERNGNAIDCPIFKIQQLVNKESLERIRIPASVRTSFSKTSSNSHLLNRIDTFRVIDPMKNANFISSEAARIKQDNNNLDNDNGPKTSYNENSENKNQLKETNGFINTTHIQNKTFQQKKILEVKGTKETKHHCPTHDCDDYDMVTYVNSLTYEENAAKRKSRKKELSYTDDLFAFVPNSSEANCEILNLSAPTARKISPHTFPFDRMKAVCKKKEKTNTTLDSDDTFNISSDLDSESVSRVSTRLRYQALKQKMNKITSSTSECEKNCNLPDENYSKVLENKNQLLNRCLRASHDYLREHENNVIEITKVQVGSKSEPLLKAISTRYFAKPSTDTNELCNNKTNNDILKENIELKKEDLTTSIDSNLKTRMLNSTLIENLQAEKEEKTNNNIDNISSITSSSTEGVDTKIGYKNISNDFTENEISVEFDQKDREIDSGLCIKSIENSLVTPDMSETKLDSETDSEKNCDIIKQKEFATRTSEVMKTFNRNCNKEKNIGIIETVSSDSKNYDIIDFDAFDIENVELFFPQLHNQVKSIKKAFSNKIINNDSSISKDSNNSKIESLESDFEISNYSSASASMSSNLNSDTDNPSSSISLINLNKNIFENVNIEFSKLRTDGLDYHDNVTKEINQKNLKINNNVQLDLCPRSCNDKISKQISVDKKVQLDVCSTSLEGDSVSHLQLCEEKSASKKNIEQNLNNDNDSSASHHSEKLVSKKMLKYRSTLETYRHKSNCEKDTKKEDEDKNVQQSDNAFHNENSQLQESRQRSPILKEIQKHMHLTFRQFV